MPLWTGGSSSAPTSGFRRQRVIIVAGPVAVAWPVPTHSQEALAWAKWRSGVYWRQFDMDPIGEPSRDEARLLKRMGDAAPVAAAQPWRTVRQALGLFAWGTETQSGKGMAGVPRSPDVRDVRDVPSPMIAGQAGNSLPEVVEQQREVVLVELCAGTASVSLHALGGLQPLVGYMGSKRRWAAQLARMLTGGTVPDRVVLVDAGPWGDVWTVLRDQEQRRAVARMLREHATRDPVELWRQMVAEPPMADPTGVVQYLILQNGAPSSVPIWWSGERWEQEGRCWSKDRTKVWGAEVRKACFSALRIGKLIQIADRVDALDALPWARIEIRCDDVRNVDPVPGASVLFDPPYNNRTRYAALCPRADVLAVAVRWQTAGARVVVCESEPLPLEGWASVRLTDREYLTISATAEVVESEAKPDWWHRSCGIDDPTRAIGSKANASIDTTRIAADRPELLDQPFATVSATEEKGTNYSGKDHTGAGTDRTPARASDSLRLATGRRRLTWEECSLLQDFPVGHPFQGTKTAKYKCVGNAVPPTLARVLALAVRDALSNLRTEQGTDMGNQPPSVIPLVDGREAVGRGALSQDEQATIRECFALGETSAELATRFGVLERVIVHIVTEQPYNAPASRNIDEGPGRRSTVSGQHTTHWTPHPAEIEAALAKGETMLGIWWIWRCPACNGPGAGGLACPHCGGPTATAYGPKPVKVSAAPDGNSPEFPPYNAAEPAALHHTCHALGCATACKPEYLMCRPHWNMVPPGIKSNVWLTYRDGQCTGDAPILPEWHHAADCAIAYVALMERRPLPPRLERVVPAIRSDLPGGLIPADVPVLSLRLGEQPQPDITSALPIRHEATTIPVTRGRSGRMYYARRVTSQLQGGCDVELGQYTLLVGENASGKSTIVRSVELALGAGASDVKGKTWSKAPQALGALLPKRDGAYSSKVVLTTGDTAIADCDAVWQCKVVDGKAKTPAHILPASLGLDPLKVLPLQHLREELTNSPERARDYLLAIVCGGVSVADVEQRIPHQLHKRFWEASGVTERIMCRDAIAALQTAAEQSAKLHRKAKAEANGAAELVQTLGAGLGAPPTEEMVQHAQSNAQAALQRMIGLRETSARLQALQSQPLRAVELQTQIGQYSAAIQQAKAQVDTAPPLPDVSQAQRRMQRGAAILTVLELQANSGGDACSLCGSAVPSAVMQARVTASRPQIEGAIAQLRTELAQVDQQKEARAHNTRQIAQAQAHLDSLMRQLQAAPAAITVDPQHLAVLQADPNAIAIAEAQHQSAAATAVQLERQHSEWITVRRARENLATQEAARDEWLRVSEACDEAVKLLVESRILHWIQKVQRYLPEGDVFGIRFQDDAGRDVVEYGLVKPAANRPADPAFLNTVLSGAEEARVLCAMGCAIAEGQACAVIIPAERSWSPSMLGKVMRALAKAPCQIILTSTVMPKRPPKTWKIVQVGAVEADVADGTVVLPDNAVSALHTDVPEAK